MLCAMTSRVVFWKWFELSTQQKNFENIFSFMFKRKTRKFSQLLEYCFRKMKKNSQFSPSRLCAIKFKKKVFFVRYVYLEVFSYFTEKNTMKKDFHMNFHQLQDLRIFNHSQEKHCFRFTFAFTRRFSVLN